MYHAIQWHFQHLFLIMYILPYYKYTTDTIHQHGTIITGTRLCTPIYIVTHICTHKYINIIQMTLEGYLAQLLHWWSADGLRHFDLQDCMVSGFEYVFYTQKDSHSTIFFDKPRWTSGGPQILVDQAIWLGCPLPLLDFLTISLVRIVPSLSYQIRAVADNDFYEWQASIADFFLPHALSHKEIW